MTINAAEETPPDTTRLSCPRCRAALPPLGQVGAQLRCERCGQTVARWHAAERRFDWGVAEALRPAAAEAASWDAWARKRRGGAQWVDLPDVETWLTKYRTFREALTTLPGLRRPVGWRTLEIGGTCFDGIKLLKGGVEHLDHIEVSAETQRLAALNLEANVEGWRERVVFHTTPAESLPFGDDSFDLVLSRSTIHHTRREQVFPEIRRVLKPGASMFIIEPLFTATAYAAMKLRRRVLKLDRGSDDPLREFEVRRLRAMFQRVRCYRYSIVWPWAKIISRFAPGLKKYDSRLWGLDLQLGSLGGLGRVLGMQCWIIATK